MSERPTSCYLKTTHESLQNVHLPDEEAIIIGRCPETNITDTTCSRQQVRLYADYTNRKVYVQQIGKKSGCINGFKTTKGDKFVVKHGDCLEIIYGKYPYLIEFNPPPPITSVAVSKKRPYESDTEEKISKSPKLELNDMDSPMEDNKDEVDETVMPTTSSSSSTPKWLRNHESLLMYTGNDVKGSTKIAGFDLDGTLIKTKSGRVFPTDCKDWQLLYSLIPTKLKNLCDEGYKIVIFTNQSGIGAGRVKIVDFQTKIEKIHQTLGVPLQAFIAIKTDIFRKPSISMWTTLENEANDGIKVDRSKSFYVGDAAGRPKNWAPGKKKDHACVDRLLALNLGIRFYTPEEYFFGHKAAPHILPTFNPKTLPKNQPLCSNGAQVTSDKQEVILMVGCPGSGKTYFAKTYLSSYAYVNRDTLGSWQKCVKALATFLDEKKSVVVDNTNGTRQVREKYIDIVKKHQIPVRCFVMSTSQAHAKHNSKFRSLHDKHHEPISEMIINSYLKHYQPPSLDEGYSEIVEANFIPKFQDPKLEELYQMFLLEN